MKINDLVLVSYGVGLYQYKNRIETITRETKTLFITDKGTKINKNDNDSNLHFSKYGQKGIFTVSYLTKEKAESLMALWKARGKARAIINRKIKALESIRVETMDIIDLSEFIEENKRFLN